MNNVFIKASNIILSLLLSFALLFLILMFFWKYQPVTIDKLDGIVKSIYMKEYRDRLENTKKLIKSDGENILILSELIELLHDLDGIKKQDRLAVIKNNSFKYLIGILADNKQYTKAIFWSEKWLDFNSKNLDAWLMTAKLYNSSGKDDKAIEILSNWNKKIPKSEKIFKQYSSILAKKNNHLHLLEVAKAYYDNRYLVDYNKWQVFWRNNKPFNAHLQKWADEVNLTNNEIVVTVNLPKNISEVRFDPPVQNFSWCMDEPIITLYTSNESFRYKLTRPELKQISPSIKWNGSNLKVLPETDPNFSWIIPRKLKDKNIKIKFTAKVNYCSNAWLVDLFSYSDLIKLEKIISQKDKNNLLATLNYIKINKFKNSRKKINDLPVFMEIFWKNKGQSYSTNRKNSEAINLRKNDSSRVNVTLPVMVDADYLRVDLPSIKGIIYDNLKVSFLTDLGQFNIKQKELSFIDIQKKNNKFLVIGDDPRIMFKVPEKYKKIISVKFKARIVNDY